MSDAGKLRRLLEGAQPEARALASRVLRQIAHDLNTALSAITMDVFSARMTLDKLRPAAGAGKMLPSSQALSLLGEICANLEHASTGLTEYGSSISQLAAANADASPPAMGGADPNGEATP